MDERYAGNRLRGRKLRLVWTGALMLAAAIAAMSLSVQFAIAEEPESLRVVYGSYDDGLSYEAMGESSAKVTRTSDGCSCHIDVGNRSAGKMVWGLYLVQNGLEYVVQEASFDEATGKLTFPANLNPSELRFEYGEKRAKARSGAVKVKAQSLSTSASGSSIPSTVDFRHGYLLYYGLPGSGHKTATFHVITPGGEELVAYCVNPPKGCVGEKELHTTPIVGGTVSIADTDMLAMVLYYSPGGPGYDAGIWPAMPDKFFGDDTDTKRERHYCCAHVLATLAAFGGKVNAYDDCSDEFIAWFKEKIAGDFVSSLKTRWSKLSKQLRNTYRDKCFMLDPINLDGAGSNAQELAVAGATLPTGDGKLQKKSSNKSLTEGNACYSLKGALYGVYESKDKASSHRSTDALAIAKTDVEGNASFNTPLAVGTYYVSEIEASPGFLRDERVYAIDVKEGKTAQVNGSAGLSEKPVDAPVKLALAKWDATLRKAIAQGAASLAGAQFEMRFYAGHYSASGLPAKPTRTWVFQTAADGTVNFSKAAAQKVSGDDLYKNADGQYTIPLGTVSVVEKKPPAGYLLEGGDGAPKTYVFQVVEDTSALGGARVKPLNYSGLVTESNTPVVADTVIRGDYRLVKEASTDTDEGASQEKSRILLKGIRFEIVNDNESAVTSPETGKEVARGGVVCTITTDENGFASTRGNASANGWTKPAEWSGALAYGTYKVREVIPAAVQTAFAEKHGAKLTPAEPWKITINSAGQYDPAPLVHNGIPQSPLRIVKVDSETGEKIALPASFQLYDHKGELVSYTARYPEKKTIDTFTSNENGELMLPMALTGGKYTVREVTAPDGYVIDEGETSFTVEENRTWDNPIEITIKNKPVKGVIELRKADAETKEAIAGAQYVVAAAEDIVTGDKTVRKKAGETVAVLVTDGDGSAVTPELYPGPYKVYETQAPDGYALDTVEHIVTVEPEGQDVPVVNACVELSDVPTKLRIRKVSADTGEPLSNAEFTVVRDDAAISGAIDEGEMPADAQNKWCITTDTDGYAELAHLAHGGYHMRETKPPVGYHASEGDGWIGFDVDDRGFAGTEEAGYSDTLTVTVENDRNQIGTSASIEGAKVASADGVVTLVDVVTYTGCTPGAEYVVTGVLHIAETDEEGNRVDGGELLAKDGSPVSASTTLVPDLPDGSAEVMFELDATELAGRSIVAFEEMRCAGELFAEHADIQDADQTVTFKPNLATTLVDEETGCHTARVSEKAVVVDTVEYEGLEVGTEYTVRGMLVDKSSGEPIARSDASTAMSDKTFTPKEADGVVTLKFAFDSSELAGREVVAFEKLFCAGNEVASHEDLDDKSQTVTFPTISTSAKDAEDDDPYIDPEENVKVIDTVSYTGLTPGRTYIVTGELHAVKEAENGQKEDAGPFKAKNGKPITSSTTFVPDKPEGEVDVEFEFDAKSLAGKKGVVFETLTQESVHVGKDGSERFVEIARHHDPADDEQTVEFRKPTIPEKVVVQVKKLMPKAGDNTRVPKAGDNAWVPIAATLGAMAILSACAVAISFTLRRRMRLRAEF